MWKTSQDLEILKRSRKQRKREYDNEGRKDKRAQRTKLQKLGEFTATRNEIDAAEDSSISQAMLESA